MLEHAGHNLVSYQKADSKHETIPPYGHESAEQFRIDIPSNEVEHTAIILNDV